MRKGVGKCGKAKIMPDSANRVSTGEEQKAPRVKQRLQWWSIEMSKKGGKGRIVNMAS